MNKKKHQNSDPNNGDDSTESCDENKNFVECSHIAKSVDLNRIKRQLVKTGFRQECEQCQAAAAATAGTHAASDADMDVNGDVEYDLSLWMCLKCAHQACGRARNQHALGHFKTPHSESHAMCVNTSSWSVWCYDCDDEVNISCKKRLLEAVDYLRKQADGGKHRQQQQHQQQGMLVPQMNNYVIELSPVTSECSSKSSSATANLPRARGLTNLGNTCFFNSVMQCLGQTPYLFELLMETSEPGQHFILPGGRMCVEGKEPEELPPLEGDLEKWRPLTASLSETLGELQNGRSETFVPRMLLSKLTYRVPQFGGGDQHDAHELLRHLLEAVREEDLKRYQTVILEKLGFNRKTDPSSVEEDKKRITKFYGQQASELLLPTEQVFRGVLVSTLQCQECEHTSHRDEYFLDLSLPIAERQIPPVLRRKAEDLDDNKPSKHQLKKEKRAERKKNKKQKSHKALNASMSSNGSLLDANVNSESESDADVEDNVESSAPQDSTMNQTDSTKGMESGYNSDKIDNSSPDSNNRGTSPDMRVDDSGVPSPAINVLSRSPESIEDSSMTNISRTSMGLKNSTSMNSPCRSPVSPENSPASSETNIDMGSPICGNNSPNDDITEEFERPESRLSFVKTKSNDLKADLAKLSLLNDGDSSKINTVFHANQMGFGVQNTDSKEAMIVDNDDDMRGACCMEDMEDTEMAGEDDDDSSMWTGTISARYQCEEGECSVQSCLNQFTACELMTGNNKVSCELCTKRHGGSEKKPVHTNATKQLLIYNPPAVLILHLKRFQVTGFRPSKVSKFVKFPTLLDLAPFCSKRSQNLPTFEIGQTKVLYSLYGVVEHSGSMHGGHYVAYIKVRPKLDENSYRWQFLPKNQKTMEKGAPKGAEAEPEVPPGKWYYISDSYVSEVQESKVLGAQAYLLFYERIL